MDGSASRTYLAAVAPPQPPPMTTTRRPGFWARSSPVHLGAQPARPATASRRRRPTPEELPPRHPSMPVSSADASVK